MDLTKYRTVFLDCDGVLLDSNRIKSDAFYDVARSVDPDPGHRNALAFLEYHQANGGITRFEKFRHYFHSILQDPRAAEKVETALSDFGTMVKRRLLVCDYIPGALEFLKLHKSMPLHVVSGGAEEELLEVFAQRGIAPYFRSINGGPRTKFQIIESLLGTAAGPYLYVGDARLDYEVAAHFSFDFVFVSGKSEFHGHADFFRGKDVLVVEDLRALIEE